MPMQAFKSWSDELPYGAITVLTIKNFNVLNWNINFIFSQAYKNSLGSEGGSHLDLTIELLETSSKLIEIFEDPKPV